MQGITIAEQGHFVNALPPQDISGGVTADVFSMENYGHASIIVAIGTSAAAFTKIIVNECTDFAGSNATAIAFNYYEETTAAGDTLSAKNSATTAGVTPSANDSIFYVIELDARELSDGYGFVQVQLTNGTNSVIASVGVVLSGSRYGNPESATAIA